MGVPYEIEPRIVGTPDGDAHVFAVPWPHRSIISKLIVTQLDGTMEQFTVAVYNHSQVETGSQVSDSEGDEVGKIPDDCFRVTPDIQANAAGKVIYFSDQATGGYGYPVFCHESRGDRQGMKVAKVYLKITPVTSAAKRYAFVIGGMKEIE